MNKIRVLIADDHAVLRSGLRMLINSQPDMEVCAEAGEGRQAVQQAMELKPDVLVMDISMPGGGGIKAIETLQQQHAEVRILVLTMHSDSAYMRSALTAGACGYVAKRAADTELLSGIRAVYQGQRFIDPALAGAVMGDFLGDSPEQAQDRADPLGRLSSRERQVLELLAQGYTNQQIADRLFLSVKTTETYRARLSHKLGLRDRVDFVRYGLETGLLSPGQLPDPGDLP